MHPILHVITDIPASDCTVLKKFRKAPATSLLEPRWEDGEAGVGVISADAAGVIVSGADAAGVIMSGAVAGGVIVSGAHGARGGRGLIPIRSKRLRMREYQMFLIWLLVLPGSRAAISDHLTDY
ncbi:hypothetical protein M0R45_001922 [Rubus argutus]|uniref:Uncharacterized protein n=1 Tax=Rubus argutus TaxID=59490 RepID=A0AAW1VKP3_RUBAR